MKQAPLPPVREFRVYREAEGSYAVDQARAEDITGAAMERLQAFTGQLIVPTVTGVRLRDNRNPLSIAQVRLPAGAFHRVLLTGRYSVPRDGQPGARSGEARTKGTLGLVHSSDTLISAVPLDADPENKMTVAGTVHQLSHTFGLGHCAAEACIMQGDETASLAELAPITASENPFCPSHAYQLAANAAMERLVMPFTRAVFGRQ